MKKLLIICTAAVAAVCNGGIKYWDNPDFKAFDVGDYVQDGLVLNYDGIRNAGATVAHDPNTTTWKNLGSGGATYDMVRYSYVNSAWTNSAEKGAWEPTGFVFDKKSIFHEMASFTVPKDYSIQTLVNATSGDQNGIGYIMCDYNDNGLSGSVHPGNWAACCMGVRTSAGGGTPDNSFYLVSSQRPYFAASSSTVSFSYATALHKSNGEGVMFPGTTAPWNATDGSYRSDLSKDSHVRDWGISLGGHYPRSDELFKGTIKNFRFYTRVLSDEEVAWNRVVDEARFFGRRAAIPVTNVVVSTTIPGIEDAHFALNAGGFTFTAPASKTVKGRRYVLGGYTLETWNGSAWGESAAHDGETSCTLSDTSGKVRLTWQYARPEGEGYLVVYDVEDYVQDGLVMHYDGIRNAGANVDHCQTASVWANLGTDGASRNLYPYMWRTGDQGHWEADGYAFRGNGVFQFLSVPYAVPTTFTVQTLIDASADNGQPSRWAHVYSGAFAKFALALARDSNYCYSNAQNLDKDNIPIFSHASRRYDYATTILNGGNSTMATFDGTIAPTSGDYTTGFRQFDGALAAYTCNDFRLGGYGAEDGSIVGKVKNLRYYPNKVLTTAELEQNRRVDEWRFFHRPSVTNVVVASDTTRPFLHGNESEGPWEVSGSYTFTAPGSMTVKGIDYACAGYTIETWNGNAWSAAVSHEGSSYAYTTAAGLVRLTWKWRTTHGLRTAADYGIDDYVQDGLIVNYDGICNAGPNADHDATAAKWVNCANPGVYDLTRYSLVNSAWTNELVAGSWADNGFVFAKDAVFHEWTSFAVPERYSIQALVDATTADQNGIGYVMCGYNAQSWDNCAFGMRSSDWNGRVNTFYLVAQGATGSRPSICAASGTEHFSYATAMLDRTNGVMFAGTTAPWTASGWANGHAVSTTKTPPNVMFVNGYSIGGHYPRTDELFNGTLKSYRFYNRVLTDAEVAHNREVDQARYFGVLTTTNVFVEAGGGTQTETGAYKVEGEWTFTATTTVNKRGETVPVARYSIETLVNGAWANKQTCDGNTYTYTEGTSPATVRLKWLGQPPGLIISVK